MIVDLTKKTKLLTGGKACAEDIEIHPVLQEKEVTENGTVVPDSGYVGLSKVAVNVPESVLDNVARPVIPKLGRLKYFTNEDSEIGYKDLYASNEDAAGVSSESGESSNVDYSIENIYYPTDERFPLFDTQSCVVNGKRYFGYPCVSVSAIWAKYRKTNAFAPLILPDVYIPPCNCTILVADAEGTEIATTAYEVAPIRFEKFDYTDHATDHYVAPRFFFNIGCNSGGGLILAAEFTYPKGTIKFVSSESADGLEYSTDDGVTFSPVENGIELRQIEHVAFRNTKDDVEMFVGTTEDARDVATIGGGATKFVAVTENATWYVF